MTDTYPRARRVDLHDRLVDVVLDHQSVLPDNFEPVGPFAFDCRVCGEWIAEVSPRSLAYIYADGSRWPTMEMSPGEIGKRDVSGQVWLIDARLVEKDGRHASGLPRYGPASRVRDGRGGRDPYPSLSAFDALEELRPGVTVGPMRRVAGPTFVYCPVPDRSGKPCNAGQVIDLP